MMLSFSQVAMGAMLSAYMQICREDTQSDVTHLRAPLSAKDISRSSPWKCGGSRTVFPFHTTSPLHKENDLADHELKVKVEPFFLVIEKRNFVFL